MIKRIAMAFGAVLLLVGILGFVPALGRPGPDGDVLLFGVFAVDPVHNIVHVLTGLIALAVGFTSEAASRTYFKVFGVVYALVALLGLFVGRGDLLGIMANNIADVALHALIAAVALYLGFARAPLPVTTTTERI